MTHCKACGDELVNVYFGDDGRSKNVQHKRCLNCNDVIVTKEES
ncbi:hypothetical protein [Orenia metallireducens]|nr:hypothetical protein [Orenia metallireducens]